MLLMFPLVEEFEISFRDFQPFVWCFHESFEENRAKNDNNSHYQGVNIILTY